MHSHLLSGEMVTTLAPSSESVEEMSSFWIRRAPRSSFLRLRMEKSLTPDIVATAKSLASEDSVAEVMFSSPC